MILTLDKSMMRNRPMQQLMLNANGPGSGVRCRFAEVFFNQADTTLDCADCRERVYPAPGQASFIELPLAASP